METLQKTLHSVDADCTIKYEQPKYYNRESGCPNQLIPYKLYNKGG
jgi:hypothetical protein